MNGTYTAVGAAAGSVIPGVGTVIGAGAGSVFDFVFGGADQGHWQGNQFVPGDLQQRMSSVNQFLAERNLTVADVDYNNLLSKLYVPSGWQGAITSYLDQVVADKKISSALAQRVSNLSSTLSNAPTNLINAGFSNSPILIILIVGALLFFFFKKK